MVKCSSCDMLMINGVVCHELGCPDAWRDELRECKECGTEFVPEEKNQEFCCEECYKIYNNLYESDGMDSEVGF